MICEPVASRLIIALDFSTTDSALEFVGRLTPGSCRLKVGKALFTRAGPKFLQTIMDAGFEVFLDLKYHDIPNTVASAVKAAADLGVWMLNVHALGGRDMLCAAREAIEQSTHRPLLIAVTILTSLSEADLPTIGIDSDLGAEVLRLAHLSYDCGLDGIVCSAQETKLIRSNLTSTFILVTPGIRTFISDKHDQKRMATPKVAIQNGSDYLVIGRNITQALEPMEAIANITNELEAALARG